MKFSRAGFSLLEVGFICILLTCFLGAVLGVTADLVRHNQQAVLTMHIIEKTSKTLDLLKRKIRNAQMILPEYKEEKSGEQSILLKINENKVLQYLLQQNVLIERVYNKGERSQRKIATNIEFLQFDYSVPLTENPKLIKIQLTGKNRKTKAYSFSSWAYIRNKNK